MKKLIYIIMFLLLSLGVNAALPTPVHYYRLDGNGLDSGSTASSLIMTNDVYQDMIINEGLVGDGAGYGKNETFPNPSSIHTIDMWINLTGASGDTAFYLGGGGTTNRVFVSKDVALGNALEIYSTFGGVAKWQFLSSYTSGMHHLVLVIGTGGLRVYIDGVLNGTDTEETEFDSNFDEIFIGSDTDGGGLWMGGLDNIALFNEQFNSTQVSESYNSGLGTDFIPPVLTSSLDILYRNSTYDYKTIFDEGENIYQSINYTLSNGINITNVTGKCNATMFDVLHETNTAIATPFTLCSGACTYNSINDDFAIDGLTNAVEDTVRIRACHTTNSVKKLSASYVCGVNSGSFDFAVNQIPLCSDGYSNLVHNFSGDCLAESTISVTLDNTAAVIASSHTISKWEVTREFSSHFIEEDEMIYNNTLNVFNFNIYHEYYKRGYKETVANCSYFADNSLDKATAENITIVDVPPVIKFSQVNSSLERLALVDGVLIEYAAGGYTWTGAVIDDDLVSFNVTWLNSSMGIIQQNLSLTNEDSLYTLASLFKDIENPYYINVSATDGVYNVTAQISFNITDTLFPVCTGVSDREWVYNKSTAFGISCTDENIFSFLLDCDNFFYNVTSLSTTLYQYTNTTKFTVNQTCDYRVADGHTSNVIDFSYVFEDEKLKFNDNKIQVSTNEPFDLFEAVKLTDRYEFNIKTKAKVNKIKFTVTADSYIYIADSDYLGHLIISDGVGGGHWIDFEEYDASFVELTRVDYNEVDVVVYMKEEKDKFKFKSIGELNVLTGSFAIGLITNPLEKYTFKNFSCDVSTTAKSILLSTFVIVMVVLFLAQFWLRIPMFSIIFGFVLGYFAWVIAPCFFLANVLFIVMALLSGMYGILLNFKGSVRH